MFSVVIPVYNHERYLVECVLSAVRSPLVSEVLLLDDGSRDVGARVCAQLAGGALPKVRDVTPQGRGNRGAHATLNELVNKAACEWVAVLNSDDVFLPSRFDLIRRRMRYSNFDMCFGNVVVIDSEGRQLGGKRAMYDPQLPFPAAIDVPVMVSSADWLPLLAHQNFLATTSNMVFRKALFEKLGGFADFRYVHDWDFGLRATLEGTVAYIPHALTGYRVHASNTIKEDSLKVDAEVRTMFEKLEHDYAALRQNSAFTGSLAANPYLLQRERPTLSVVLPAGEGDETYRIALRNAFSGIEITSGDATGRYIYAPTSALKAMHPMHLQNALLALEMQEMDFLLVSHTLAAPPQVGTQGLRNATVFERSHRDIFVEGRRATHRLNGTIARLFPGGGAFESVSDLLPGVTIAAPSPRSEPLTTSLSFASTPKPVIFVLPAFFAVGGVERLVIDMMRQLGDRFTFVVVTVERLTERQGSLHGAAEGTIAGFYDLGELAPPELFLRMMERLRDVYRPALVWLPNGSPWQCDHAAGIRHVFSKIPIVDQQVYDTEAGWIARYHELGIRSYDWFIAINRKIEQTFIHKYGIPAERIDMIYHSVNLGTLGPAERTGEDRRQYRFKWGLPEDKQIFGWVGRFTPQKRPAQFLEFARAAGKADPNRHFVMMGDGELGVECDRIIEHEKITNVTRIRFSDRMGELFAVMDGMLGSSEYEGLPISMLEALAMGVPIYSTDVGDVALVLADYNAGRVTDADWDLARYLAGFEEWTRDLARYRQSAQHSAAQVRRRFGSESVAAQYERCFRKSLVATSVNATLESL